MSSSPFSSVLKNQPISDFEELMMRDASEGFLEALGGGCACVWSGLSGKLSNGSHLVEVLE
jgi:hypothetical protein